MRRLTYTLLIIFFALAGSYLFYRFLISPQTVVVNQVSTTSGPPLTGTFYMSDLVLSEAELASIAREIKSSGMDTIIMLAAGDLSKNTDGSYFEKVYFSDPAYNFSRDLLKIAHQQNLKLYYGLTSADPQIRFNVGTPDDLNTDQGKLIDFSLRLSDEIKNATAIAGVPWDTVAGFYIGQEAWPEVFSNTGTPEFRYYQVLTQRLKTKHPDKKILISPYRYQRNTYSQALSQYENAYRDTAVDIIAPQDSIGSTKVTSFAKSGELFRALHDAAIKYPGKEAWANIETFSSPEDSWNYFPTSIMSLEAQINAAAPHVSKMITWIYQHTMLSDPSFDNRPSSWSSQYTPDLAAKRKILRSAYLAKYIPAAPMYYFHTGQQNCVATSASYSDTATCQNNLAAYLPGQTAGICYPTLDACTAAHPDQPDSIPGDFFPDGHVDLLDFNHLLTNFGNPYTLLDFNTLLSNFGRP